MRPNIIRTGNITASSLRFPFTRLSALKPTNRTFSLQWPVTPFTWVFNPFYFNPDKFNLKIYKSNSSIPNLFQLRCFGWWRLFLYPSHRVRQSVRRNSSILWLWVINYRFNALYIWRISICLINLKLILSYAVQCNTDEDCKSYTDYHMCYGFCGVQAATPSPEGKTLFLHFTLKFCLFVLFLIEFNLNFYYSNVWISS